ncbi:hypothetical protein E1091_01560 [Micromonospora fluostatini]|uniref:Uncharacterized protein n=1 Tax=Micromonospora fluostatini TaxID=1629071 RepID=A0ABY2DLF9_9ACTN|nr:hypothetical protein E1091_01560 [Micromonospora fluostatini]
MPTTAIATRPEAAGTTPVVDDNRIRLAAAPTPTTRLALVRRVVLTIGILGAITAGAGVTFGPAKDDRVVAGGLAACAGAMATGLCARTDGRIDHF